MLLLLCMVGGIELSTRRIVMQSEANVRRRDYWE